MEDFENEVVCFMHTCARSGDRIPVCFVRSEASALMEKISIASARNAPEVEPEPVPAKKAKH